MITPLIYLALEHVSSALQFGDIEGGMTLSFFLEAAASIFSLVLFFVTIYAWSRRQKQPALLIVSIAFLVYFSKLVIEFLPIGELHDDLIASMIDFVTLGLFFIALVVKPQRGRKIERKEANSV
jgi:preprotein translocase subunit YajC